MNNKCIYLIFAACTLQLYLHNTILGQDTLKNNLIKKIIIVNDSVELVENNYIIQNSINIIPNLKFRWLDKKIMLYNDDHNTKEVLITYRILAFNPDLIILANDSARHQAIDQSLPMSYKFHLKEETKKEESAIQYNGAFGRGLSFGNSQSTNLHSVLNMEIHGKIGDDIEIHGAITDETLPIQPDGNTLQLNQFDRVFLELKRRNQSLSAGDLQLKPDNTYFLKYFKKYKGFEYKNQTTFFNKSTFDTRLSTAIARGNYKRQSLEISEGNQGPYRLTGNQNEVLIIILSGSEKVYLDGMPLVRGFDHDYVIDYNRGEITFTARRIINRNARIVVEFEYSNQSYLKSAISLQSKYSHGAFSIQWNSYVEGDNKNSNNFQTLSLEDKIHLADAGDRISGITKSTIQQKNFTNRSNEIYYRKIDTQINGRIYKNVLLLSSDHTAQLYTAQFAYVGKGNGNYIVDNEHFTNGRSYAWIPPDLAKNTLQGEYEPSVSIVAPGKKSMHSLHVDYTPGNGFYTNADIALSDYNMNLFSTKDKSNDVGSAFRQSIGYITQINKINWSNEISYESLSDQFNLFEQFRNPEFTRNWNLQTILQNKKNNLFNYSTKLNSKNFDVKYNFQKLQYGEQYSGNINDFDGKISLNKTTFQAYQSILSNNSSDTKGSFNKSNYSLEQTMGAAGDFKLGIEYKYEKNNQVSHVTHLLTPNSLKYEQLRGFLVFKNPSNTNHIKLEFIHRSDQYNNLQRFNNYFTSNDLMIENQIKINNNSSWNLVFGNRTISYSKVIDPLRDINKNSLIIKNIFNAKTKNNFFRYYNSMESSTGQEPSLEYTYLKVNKGLGYYTWIDSNHDSIPQVSEFVPASYTDQGEYVRYATTTNQFIATKNYQLFQNIELDGSRLNLNKRNLISKISLISNLNLTWKENSTAAWSFPIYTRSSSLISLQDQIRNLIYFNRNNSEYELQLGHLINTNKYRLNTGYEIRNSEELFSRTRVKIKNYLSVESYLASANQSDEVEHIQYRNYKIHHLIIEPKCNFQNMGNTRISLSYQTKVTSKDHQKILSWNQWKTEFSSTPIPTWSIRSSFSLVHAKTLTELDPILEYTILQGLQKGNNLLIQINIDKQMNPNTILRLGYDARQSSQGRYLQTGSAQIIAGF